ncbi:MAG: hypothetical protein HFH88_01715 [Lachnospiraceae bacterium]|nr:hypothetical protein [Lachnospiraceae bacterium]
MTANQKEWAEEKKRLVDTVKSLGFPEELGEAVAKNLGSPKAMKRMVGYLESVRPQSAELVVDEMLAICSEISAWKAKKAGRNL